MIRVLRLGDIGDTRSLIARYESTPLTLARRVRPVCMVEVAPASIQRRQSLVYTGANHVYMSGPDTTGGDDGPETVQINLRLSKAFLEDIDATWQEQGFNSRSEFLRYAARDAVKHPEFSRGGWKQIAASEHDLRSSEAELVSRKEVIEMMDRDEGAE